VRREVVGELLMPIAERLQQERARYGRVDPVDDPGCRDTDRLEGMGMPPVQRERDELIDEAVRRSSGVLRDPAHPSGQLQDRLPVHEGWCFLRDLERLPRWEKAGQSSGTLVPGEDVFHRSIDHARILQPHCCAPVPARRPTGGAALRVLQDMGEPSGGITL